MPTNAAVKKAIALLNKADLSTEDKSLLITALLRRVAALPLNDIIYTNRGGDLFVKGRKVGREEETRLRESAASLLKNAAFRLIQEQAIYTAFIEASTKARTAEDLLFCRAAMWWGNKENDFVHLLARDQSDTGTSPDLLEDL